MKLNISPALSLAFYAVCGSFAWRELALLTTLNSAQAQISPDNTTNTTVTQDGNITEITGGTARGNNLFHSFRDFSVESGGTADFLNTPNISRIFSRVTGGNISNIDGLLRTNGTSLFLINPAGILFGAGARLDLGGGSFYGSSADSILFDDGEFSATDLENPPLLTVNAPIGLSFRDEPGSITTTAGATLEVDSNQALALIGGEVNLNGATLNGGKITLGGLSGSGIVDINDDLSFTFPDNITKADVFVTNGSSLGVFGTTEGFISFNARNINFTEASKVITGTGNDILIQADGNISLDGENLILAQTSTDLEGNAGDITIEANGQILLDNKSLIINQVGENTVGNAGTINLNSNSVELSNGSLIISETNGKGNTGNIEINAFGDVVLDQSGIFNQINVTGEGNAGNIIINASNLEATDLEAPGNFATQTLLLSKTVGRGNAGDINLNIEGNITFATSSLLSQVDIDSETGNQGIGESGDIIVEAGSLTLKNNSLWQTSTKAQGNAGNITINVAGDINLNNENTSDVLYGSNLILSQVLANATGDAGDITITSRGSLNSVNSFIISDSKSQGDGGDITIDVADTITLEGIPIQEGRDNVLLFPSAIVTGLDEDRTQGDRELISAAEGEAGSINISANQLIMKDLAFIINNTEDNTIGDAGDINITVDNLSIQDNAFISAFTENRFNGGFVNINAQNLELIRGGKIITATNGGGNAGNINLNIADSIEIDGSGKPSATIPELFIDEPFIDRLQDQTGLFANATEDAGGNGGNITIGEGTITPTSDTRSFIFNPTDVTNSVSIVNRGVITADSQGTGSGGQVFINANELTLNNEGSISVLTTASDNTETPANQITLKIDDSLTLSNSSTISAEALNDANGGNINIDAKFMIAEPSQGGGGSDIIASAEDGQGGNIEIATEQIFNLAEREATDNNSTNDIDASSDFGVDGNVSIDVLDTDSVQGLVELPTGVIETEQATEQVCNAGQPTANNTNSLIVRGRGGISPTPTEPLSTDVVLTHNSFGSPANGEGQSSQTIPDETSGIIPIDLGDRVIYPARGVIVKENGEVILTPYPTANNASRLPYSSDNCKDS